MRRMVVAGAVLASLALAGAGPAPGDAPALARMKLDAPRGLRERLLRRLVVLSLRRTMR